jgi:hypothetical protein
LAMRQLPDSPADLLISCGDLSDEDVSQETVVGAVRVIGVYGFRQLVIPE